MMAVCVSASFVDITLLYESLSAHWCVSGFRVHPHTCMHTQMDVTACTCMNMNLFFTKANGFVQT